MVVSGDFTSIIATIFRQPTTRPESRRQFPEARFLGPLLPAVRTLRDVLRSIAQACRDPSTCASIRRNWQELVVGILVGKEADPLTSLLGDTNFLNHLERPYGLDITPATI
jgi:hypothetical protein